MSRKSQTWMPFTLPLLKPISLVPSGVKTGRAVKSRLASSSVANSRLLSRADIEQFHKAPPAGHRQPISHMVKGQVGGGLVGFKCPKRLERGPVVETDEATFGQAHCEGPAAPVPGDAERSSALRQGGEHFPRPHVAKL